MTSLAPKYIKSTNPAFLLSPLLFIVIIANSWSFTLISHSSLGDLGVAVHDDEHDEEQDDEEEEDHYDWGHGCRRFLCVGFSYFEARLGEMAP